MYQVISVVLSLSFSPPPLPISLLSLSFAVLGFELTLFKQELYHMSHTPTLQAVIF
jgi:hypothetical protein